MAPKVNVLSLPVELHLNIFLVLDAVSTASAFARAHSSFREIYSDSESRTRIFDAIFPRQILCYDEALLLVEEQKRPPSISIKADDRRVVDSDPDKTAAKLLENQKVVDSSARFYEESMLENWGFQPNRSEAGGSAQLQLEFARADGMYVRPPNRLPHFTITERERFTKTFYQFWRLALLFRCVSEIEDYDLDPAFDLVTTRELVALSEMERWLRLYIIIPGHNIRVPWDGTEGWLGAAKLSARTLKERLISLGHHPDAITRDWFLPRVGSDEAPDKYWTLLDGTQYYMEKFPEEREPA